MSELKRATAEMQALLAKAGDFSNPEAAKAANYQVARALEEVIRKEVWHGDILFDIYTRTPFGPGQVVEYPKHWFQPGKVKEFTAVVLPNAGRIPQKQVVGDYVTVPTYPLRAEIDTLLRYIRDARWDVVGSLRDAMMKMWTYKLNQDGWHTILAAAEARNIIQTDSAAAQGLFTKRLVSLMKTTMQRNGGGNSTSMDKGVLTDIFLSPECMEDIRSWDLTQIDDISRREIYVGGDTASMFKVNLTVLNELGESQIFQDYFTATLGGSLGSDLELLVGLDLANRDSFKMPIREEPKVFVDEHLHREQKWGLYMWGEIGFSVLDNRRVILGTA